jgi:ABC-type molybdate transport system substrate-binding protein
VTHSRQPQAAQRFLLFLTGPQATPIFRKFGFTPLATMP